MSDTSIPTPSSAFSASPREQFFIQDITKLDAESAAALKTIKGLLV
jgi:hypothetical protein